MPAFNWTLQERIQNLTPEFQKQVELLASAIALDRSNGDRGLTNSNRACCNAHVALPLMKRWEAVTLTQYAQELAQQQHQEQSA